MACPIKKFLYKCPVRRKFIKASLSFLKQEWKNDESLDFNGLAEDLWKLSVEVYPYLPKEKKAAIANMIATYKKEISLIKEIFPDQLNTSLEKSSKKLSSF